MRLIKIYFTLTMIFVLGFTCTVYAEPKEGWQGYGLYNIDSSKISIINEDVHVKLEDDKLIYEGEFLIRNYNADSEKAVLGMPSRGIEKINLSEKGNTIKLRNRSYGSLYNEFSIDNQLPKEDNWVVFYLNMGPGETKLIDIELEAFQDKDEQNNYVFTYYNDRKIGYSNNVEKTSLYLELSDFEPYNLLQLQGIDAKNVGEMGDIVLKSEEDNIDAVSLKYADITKTASDKLLSSAMYRPREIALNFKDKNYIKTSALCDEYMKNPNDSQISQEQILFFKAESLRRLQNVEKYLQIVEAMDYSKLYPAELKNKIIYDRINIYIEQQNHDKLSDIYKEMESDETESTKLLRGWIEGSSVFGASQINIQGVFEQLPQAEDKAQKPASVIEELYMRAMDFKYTPAILFVVGVLTGLFLKKISFRRRRRRSMYIYRM